MKSTVYNVRAVVKDDIKNYVWYPEIMLASKDVAGVVKIDDNTIKITADGVIYVNAPVRNGSGECSLVQTTVLGEENEASGSHAAAFGHLNKALANDAFVTGQVNEASENSSAVIMGGNQNIMLSSYGIVSGQLNVDGGWADIVVGTSNSVNVDSDKNIIEEGSSKNNIVTGWHNDVQGDNNAVSGHDNIVRCDNTEVSGYKNEVYHDNSRVSGEKNKLYGSYIDNNVSGNNNTINSGNAMFVSGHSNIITSGQYSIIAGYNNVISNQLNTVFGYNNNVKSSSSFVGGNSNEAAATGGSNVILLGKGLYSGQKNQIILGQYNKANGSIFAIGNGTDNSNRRNVFDIDGDGEALIYTDPTKENSLVHKKYVDNLVSQIKGIRNILPVTELPTTDISTTTLYLLKEEDNSNTEYLYVNNSWEPIGTTAISITIDDKLSDTSENAVQNKVIKEAIDVKLDRRDDHWGSEIFSSKQLYGIEMADDGQIVQTMYDLDADTLGFVRRQSDSDNEPQPGTICVWQPVLSYQVANKQYVDDRASPFSKLNYVPEATMDSPELIVRDHPTSWGDAEIYIKRADVVGEELLAIYRYEKLCTQEYVDGIVDGVESKVDEWDGDPGGWATVRTRLTTSSGQQTSSAVISNSPKNYAIAAYRYGGTLRVNEPQEDLDAANKKYVDDSIANQATKVVANNGEETTEELSTIKVGDTNYSLPSGGGGGTEINTDYLFNLEIPVPVSAIFFNAYENSTAKFYSVYRKSSSTFKGKCNLFIIESSSLYPEVVYGVKAYDGTIITASNLENYYGKLLYTYLDNAYILLGV